ncbi:hypothetical protein ADUPG1_009038, partial [Aduncisulcus paluster]
MSFLPPWEPNLCFMKETGLLDVQMYSEQLYHDRSLLVKTIASFLCNGDPQYHFPLASLFATLSIFSLNEFPLNLLFVSSSSQSCSTLLSQVHKIVSPLSFFLDIPSSGIKASFSAIMNPCSKSWIIDHLQNLSSKSQRDLYSQMVKMKLKRSKSVLIGCQESIGKRRRSSLTPLPSSSIQSTYASYFTSSDSSRMMPVGLSNGMIRELIPTGPSLPFLSSDGGVQCCLPLIESTLKGLFKGSSGFIYDMFDWVICFRPKQEFATLTSNKSLSHS